MATKRPIVIRMKRKRDEEAVEAMQIKRKRRRKLERSFGDLSTSDSVSGGVFCLVKSVEEKDLESAMDVGTPVRVMDLQTPSCLRSQVEINGRPARSEAVAAFSEQELEMDRAVWEAFTFGSFEAMLFHLERGKEVNFLRRLADWTTPLMACAVHGKEEIAKALLQAGANPHLCSASGKKAIDFARERSHLGTVAILEQFEEEPTSEMDDYVYDVYVESDRAPSSFEAIPTVEVDQELWQESKDEEEELSEDSNAEDYIGADYPEDDLDAVVVESSVGEEEEEEEEEEDERMEFIP